MKHNALASRVVAAMLKYHRAKYPRVVIRSVRHIYPRAYVIAKPAPLCLVVVMPWVDAEPHMRDWEKSYGSTMLMSDSFDETIQSGDWCSVAYVATDTGGKSIAIKVVP